MKVTCCKAIAGIKGSLHASQGRKTIECNTPRVLYRGRLVLPRTPRGSLDILHNMSSMAGPSGSEPTEVAVLCIHYVNTHTHFYTHTAGPMHTFAVPNLNPCI